MKKIKGFRSIIAKTIKRFKVWILDTFYKDFQFGIVIQNNHIEGCEGIAFITKCDNLYINEAKIASIQKIKGLLVSIETKSVNEY